MITADEARKIAQNEINKITPKDVPTIIIKTIEFDEGWLFHYDSKKWVETGKILERFLGNVPIIVDKQYGTTYYVRINDWSRFEELESPKFCSELLKRYKNGSVD
jgi:hypothetical protein